MDDIDFEVGVTMPADTPPKPFVVPVFIPHAGCPHRCVFCNQTSTTGCTELFPDASAIKKTIDIFLGYGGKGRRPIEIAFFGGNFLGLESRRITDLLTIAADYIHQGNAQGIRFSTRPDTIDPYKLDLISDFPVSTVELGVQSMNDEVLRLVRRGHTADDTLRAVARLKEKPYQLGLQMMVGLPGDSESGAVSTSRRMAECEPDFVRIYPTLVLKGSPLARWYADKRYTPLALDRCVQLVKSLYLVFARHGIRVIRMGLQPTSELNDHAAVLAGPYHPAFGELVHGAVFLDTILAHLREAPLGRSALRLTVHPRNLSRLQGQKRINFDTLQSVFKLRSIDADTDPELSSSMILINGRPCRLPV